ncbi:MAG TPA: histidinol-phosphate transaminase [Anaerolineales bacterium]|nr:histidinol-phosphate transaminase [Anaerolineales bacterium]
MFDPVTLIRPHIQKMPAYAPILPFEVLSQQLGLSPGRIVKLDANENPYGMLPAVRKALTEMPFPHIYPDPESRELRRALAEYHGIPFENILAGAGADELIDLVLRLTIDPGEAILNCPPTFGMYPFDGDLCRARVVDIPRREDFSLDLPGIERAVRQFKPKLIFVTSPNNPDGSLVPSADLKRLLELPLLVVLDEAYMEFAAPGHSLLKEVQQRKNLVVLRTFSKWAGLAGLRIGFGAFPEALMPHLWKIKQPYNVSVAASSAAIAALQHAAELNEIGERITAERERMYARLGTIPALQPYPSQSNFILCRVAGMDAGLLKKSLAKAGILVRYFDKPGLQDCIRISVGKPEQTERLILELRKIATENTEFTGTN